MKAFTTIIYLFILLFVVSAVEAVNLSAAECFVTDG